MKKIVRLFPILILFIISFSIVLMNDMEQKEGYKNIQSYQSTHFTLSDTENVDNYIINKIYSVADENHVYLEKTIYDEETKSINNYYSTDNVFELFDKQFDIEDGLKRKYKSITTYENNESYRINDFLNNDRYGFYPIDDLTNNKVYNRGSYTLYYQNEIDAKNFMKEASNILHTSEESLTNEFSGQFEEHIDIVLMVMGFTVIFFMLFYFIITVFLFYQESKQIGILSLLGFSNKDIIIEMNKSSLFGQIAACVFIWIVVLLLPNINFTVFAWVMIMHVIMLVITAVLLYIALIIVQKYTDLSNVLKKQKLVGKISFLCLSSKFVIVGILLVFMTSMIPFVKESTENTQKIQNNKVLMDYAVFPRINVDNGQHNDYERYLKFYNKVIEENIEHIYVNFEDYLETNQEYVEEYENMERNGVDYRIASVDKNYMNQYSLKYYDDNSNEIQLQTIDQEIYLLPESKKQYTKSLKERIKRTYKKYKINHDIKIFYYDDFTFDTYDSENGIQDVKSPILRIIDNNNPYTYMQNIYGLDIAGTGMNTGLKFKITKNNDLFEQRLKTCINTSGLDQTLIKDNFISYQDYLSDAIANEKKLYATFTGGVLLALIFYITLVIQTFILYMESKKDEILVKSILGFKRKDMFLDIIYWNLGVTLIPVAGFVSYHLTSQSPNLLMAVIISLSVLCIDFLLSLFISTTMNTKNIYSEIKGG